MAHIILRHRDIPDLDQLDVYVKHGGIEALKKALTQMQPDQVTDVVKSSGLRGRGGAGFPTGVKWSFLPKNIWPHYVVANADESEPGTFKDREILEFNPYQFLEGLAIASFAVQANLSYVYLRGEFWYLADKLEDCIAELEKAGFLGDKLFGRVSLRLRVRQAGLHLRRRDCPARILGGQTGPATHPPAFPGGGRPVRKTDRDQQRGDPGQPPAHHPGGRGGIPQVRHGKEPGR
jgi:NADH-quinone oxidoreductase subunit F